MTGKELQRLSRRDLLELLVQQEQQNVILQDRVLELEKTVKNRNIEISKTGTLAEAALALNDVFESADKAASQYLDNIKRLSDQQESIYNKIVSAAQRNAKVILEDAEQERLRRLKAADEYWQGMNAKLEQVYQETYGPPEFVPILSRKKS